jgi:hypothetical protein
MKGYLKLYFVLLLALGYGQLLRKVVTDTGGFSSKYGAAIIATILVFAPIGKSRELAVGKYRCGKRNLSYWLLPA